MSISPVKIGPLAVDVSLTADSLHVFLADGQEVSVPLEWFPLRMWSNLEFAECTVAPRSECASWRVAVGYVMTMHADEEADEDGLSILDIESVILTGSIVERQRDGETWELKSRNCPSPHVLAATN